jgi:lipoprotein NlpI
MRAVILSLLLLIAFLGNYPGARAALDDDPKLKVLVALDDWKKGEKKKALEAINAVLDADPKNAMAYLARGTMRLSEGKYADAVADFDKCLELEPKNADAYLSRGMAHFMLGKVKESATDFDKEIELKPERGPGHWMRGISLYYAGRFEEGKKQFDAYQKTDSNDVENAVWHFLCAAKADGIDKARAGILKIGKDRRVPMMQVYELYKGKLKPEDVLAAASEPVGKDVEGEGKRRLFYAHLYLGIYADVTGDRKKAEEHLTLAAGKYKIAHYMGDVARVHLQLLRTEKK